VLFGLGGNILVNSGKDGVLIVDDQFPQLKNKIMNAIRKIGGRKIDYIVNSHWHFDHAEGNIAFGKTGSRIIAHENSRFMMINPQPINLVSVVYPQQPYPSHALPQITYQNTMTVNLNGEEIGLYNFGSAHTTGDTAVYLKQSNILHMGDVFNMSGFPFIDADNGGNIDGIIYFCQSILSVINDETVVVPGHGPISTTQDIQNYIDMLVVVRDRIKNLIDKEKTLEEVLEAHPAQEWEAGFGDATLLVDRAYTGLLN
jgi:glyoxylase-like metal-dependent hydrolase (beta-lactamase superfamily II)